MVVNKQSHVYFSFFVLRFFQKKILCHSTNTLFITMAQNHLPSLAAPVLPVGLDVPASAPVVQAVSAVQSNGQRRLLFEKANAAAQKYSTTLLESDFQILLEIMSDYEEDNVDSLADL